MNNLQIDEKVTLDLSTELGDHSVGKVEVRNEDDSDTHIANTLRINASASEDQQVWLSITGHTYARVGWAEPFTTSADYISHHFTKAEAQALLAVLIRELSKLD